jgi:hypothetical protein
LSKGTFFNLINKTPKKESVHGELWFFGGGQNPIVYFFENMFLAS